MRTSSLSPHAVLWSAFFPASPSRPRWLCSAPAPPESRLHHCGSTGLRYSECVQPWGWSQVPSISRVAPPAPPLPYGFTKHRCVRIGYSLVSPSPPGLVFSSTSLLGLLTSPHPSVRHTFAFSLWLQLALIVVTAMLMAMTKVDP